MTCYCIIMVCVQITPFPFMNTSLSRERPDKLTSQQSLPPLQCPRGGAACGTTSTARLPLPPQPYAAEPTSSLSETAWKQQVMVDCLCAYRLLVTVLTHGEVAAPVFVCVTTINPSAKEPPYLYSNGRLYVNLPSTLVSHGHTLVRWQLHTRLASHKLLQHRR